MIALTFRPWAATWKGACSIATTRIGRTLALHRLGSALPRLRDTVGKALSAPELTRNNVIAAVVRLIDRALLRPGHDEYAQATGSRGASTLLKSDVAVTGDKVVVEFKGKAGKPVRREVKDRLLARVTRRLLAGKGRRLFSAVDDNGRVRPVTAREVNAFLAEASGTDVTAKDFRTFRASAEALAFLTERNGHETERLKKQTIVQAADRAREILVNTRSVARSSYIHPVVIKAYESGKLGASLFRGPCAPASTGWKARSCAFLRQARTSATIENDA